MVHGLTSDSDQGSGLAVRLVGFELGARCNGSDYEIGSTYAGSQMDEHNGTN